jgi:non-ribosomal peptide synthetase component F
MGVLVVDDNLLEVSPGQECELLMNGPQMSLGYWKDPPKTAAAFMVPPGKNEIYYRTGDRVRRPQGIAPLTHLGRIDSQVKIFGHRVELGEVESRVRNACGFDGGGLY